MVWTCSRVSLYAPLPCTALPRPSSALPSPRRTLPAARVMLDMAAPAASSTAPRGARSCLAGKGVERGEEGGVLSGVQQCNLAAGTERGTTVLGVGPMAAHQQGLAPWPRHSGSQHAGFFALHACLVAGILVGPIATGQRGPSPRSHHPRSLRKSFEPWGPILAFQLTAYILRAILAAGKTSRQQQGLAPRA